MLGLSWTEMLVIGVVALIVIGPKDLPVVMGKVGKVIGQIQRMGRDFQREINKTTGLDEVRNLRNSITSPLKQTADEIRREFNTMTADGPKPSGAIKPADPNGQSVVDEIREKAGMPPAAKSNDELAAEYGFKSKTAEATEPKPVTEPAPSSEPVKAARSSSAKADAAEVADKTAKKPRAKAEKAEAVTEAADAPKPAAKPRAARKKTSAPTEKSE